MAKADGATAVAITEHGNMYSAFKLHKACKEAEIKSIYGIETYICNDMYTKGLPENIQKQAEKLVGDGKKQFVDKEKKRLEITKHHHLNLWAMNNVGLKNLFKLSTLAFTEGFYSYPRIDYKVLKQYSAGICAGSACQSNDFFKYKDAPQEEQDRYVELYLDIFGKENLYIEIMMHGQASHEFTNHMLKVANRFDLKLLATNDVHYKTKEAAYSQKILMAINRNMGSAKKITVDTMVEDEFFSYPPELYYKSSKEMCQQFAGFEQALLNTNELAERCDAALDTGRKYPKFEVPEGHTVNSYLVSLCKEGFEKKEIPKTKEYKDRLKYELSVISKTGFSEYFLVVQDFVKHAKDRGIFVGAGRGSGAASLVAYAIDITGIDPVKYDLDFNRMLCVERVSPPDFDVDFADDHRELVIDYVKEKYGANAVSTIGAFGTLSARAALKDTGTVLKFDFATMNAVTKECPKKPAGLKINRRVGETPSALEMSAGLRKCKEQYPDLFRIAEEVEGCYRHTSKHASGVLIAPGDIVDYLPLAYRAKDGSIFTQWDKDDIDAYGMLKADILGISTLRTMREAIKYTGEEININKISFEDDNIYELFRKAETTGIFQFGSGMMKRMLIDFQPTELAHLSDANAIGRPGPLISGMDKMYARRKRGEEASDAYHIALNNVLGKTFQLMVYQEQAMAVARIIGGFSIGEADDLRKAMGKKKADLIEKLGGKFVNGAEKNGYGKELGNKIYNDLKNYVGYCFNLSHSISYSYLAYQTAWLKHYYPLQYMCALLNTEIGDSEKIAEYSAECKRMGISILEPDIRYSEDLFTMEGSTIRCGLSNIKGLTAATKIKISQVKNRLFKSFKPFVCWAFKSSVDKTSFEALVESGSLDFYATDRLAAVTFFNSVASGVRKAITTQKKFANQLDLFEVADPVITYIKEAEIPNEVEPWQHAMTKQVSRTSIMFREIGGLSGEESLTGFSGISDLPNQEGVTTLGFVSKIKKTKTRKGDDMAFVTMADGTGNCDIVIFPKVYAKIKDILTDASILKIHGVVDGDKVIANEIVVV